jgi:hypothetical protein
MGKRAPTPSADDLVARFAQQPAVDEALRGAELHGAV